MFSNAASEEDALRASIDALAQIVELYDRLGLMYAAVHAETALQAARAGRAQPDSAPAPRARETVHAIRLARD